MSDIYRYEFETATEALKLLWNVEFMNSGKTGVHGVIGPIISGKNYFVRDLLKAQGWESCCVTLDLKSNSITNCDEALKRLDEILDGGDGADRLLLIKHGDLKPHIVKELIERIIDDRYPYDFRLILYTCLYPVDKKFSYTYITHLGDDEIISMFGRFTNLLEVYDVKLTDLTESRCDIDYRSTGLIQAMSNHLRDLGIRSKTDLVDALIHWRTHLWYDYDPTDVGLYETYRDIIANDPELRRIADELKITVEDAVGKCMDILVFLALNGSTTSVRKPLLNLLVSGDSEPFVMRLRELSMITVDHNRDPFLRFNCDMPQYIKALFKRYLWDNPEADYGHVASVYATYAALFLVKPEVRLRIVRENGSALVGFLNHLRHRRFGVGNDAYGGSFELLSNAVHRKCALRKLKPEVSARYLLMYFFSRLAEEKGLEIGNGRVIDTDTLLNTRLGGEWRGKVESPVAGLVDLGTLEAMEDWSFKDNLLVPVFGGDHEFSAEWFTNELAEFNRKLAESNRNNNHGAELTNILEDDQELERLRMSVNGYFRMFREYNGAFKTPLNEYDCAKHLFYITCNLMHRMMPQSLGRGVELMFGFLTPRLGTGDVYDYSDDFDVLEGCLRMLFELDVVDIQTDYSIGPVIDCIKRLLDEQMHGRYAPRVSLQDPTKGWWDISALILSHIVEHSVDGSLGDVTDIKQELNRLLSMCEEPEEGALRPFDNGSRNMIYFETRLAVCRLNRVESNASPGSLRGDDSVTAELEGVRDAFKKSLAVQAVYRCTEKDFVEPHPFFVVAPVSMAPADAKLTILHFEYTYNRLKGEIEIDTRVKAENPFEGCERCYRRYCNYQDFRPEGDYDRSNDDKAAMGDERIIELAYLRARYLYANSRNNKEVERLCISARGWLENLGVNAGDSGGLLNNELYVDIQILFANLNLRMRRFVDVRSVLDQINDVRCKRSMHRMQRVRADEINARYLETTYNNTVGARDVALLEEARRYYLEAEKLSVNSSRAWVHMKMKSEVYRMDVLLNNTSDLFARSEMLLTYLDTDFAFEHRNTYRKIVKNLLGLGWSNE